MEKNESTLALHFAYTVTILVGLLVFIATNRWSTHENFTSYLSNAATLTSLILSVVAIFYSMVSNGDFAKSLGNLAKVSDDVSAAKTALTTVVEKSDALVESGQVNAEKLGQISDQMKARIDEINETLASFKAQNTNIHEELTSLQKKLFEAPSPALTSSIEASGPTNSAFRTSDAEVRKFLSSVSIVGQFATFSAILAHNEKAELQLEEVEKLIDLQSSAAYMHGIIVAMNSMGLIKTKSGNSFRSCLVIEVCPYFASITEDDMFDTLERKSKNLSQQGQPTAKWRERLQIVTKYLKEQSQL